MTNGFCHVELTSADINVAIKFYKKMFDWKLKAMPNVGYTLIDAGVAPGGGMQAKPMPEAPTGWMPYVQVASVKRALVKAEKNGAKVALPYMSIGENGAIGIFIDPAGSMLGVWEAPAKKAAKKPAKKPAKKTAKKR